jgi:hypothetical protein
MTDSSESFESPDRPLAQGRPFDAPDRKSAQGKSPAGVIAITAGELLWLTLAVWVGGIFILTLLPVLLIPRLGMPLGVIASYLVFFLAWQPVQTITQRTLGMKPGVIRMVLFVGGAATIAFYLREALLRLSRP